MTKSYIYNMAMSELLRKIDKEEKFLNERKSNGLKSPIAEARLERYYKEEKELHEMILEAERAAQ